MNKFIYILLTSLLIVSCKTSKDGIVKSDAPISAKDYPYIDAFHKGMQYKVQSRREEAILELEKCLEIRKDDDAVYYALSELELERGNTQASSNYIVKAHEIAPDNIWYIQELAYMFYETGDYEQSAKYFKQLVDKEPRNVDWMYAYSEALMRNGQDKEAIKVFEEMEAQVGKHPHFAIQRYNIKMKTGDVSGAEQELLRARKEFPKEPSIIGTLVDHYFRTNQPEKAEMFLEELVQADPTNGRAHLALADIYQRRNEMDRAYSELKLAFESEDVDIDTKMKVLIGIQEQGPSIPEEMYPILETFVAMYPDNAKVYSIQGDYLMNKEDIPGALASYKQALELDNSLYPIWNQVLVLEYQMDDFEALFKDSKECLELYPTIATVYLLHGISANKTGHFSEAKDALAVGVEVVVNDAPMKAEFYGQMGEASFGLQEFDDAIKHYKKALTLDSKSTLIKNNFARRLAAIKRDLDLALSLAKQITDAFPEEETFLDTYGWVYFQKGDYKEAQKWYAKVLGINPENAMTLEHMGDVYFKQNNTKDALEYWNLAAENGGNSNLLKKKIADKKYYEPEF